MIIKLKYYKHKAFTLAEVLITLLIIGVVASLIIPNLINDSKKAEYVTKLQKEYAVLQQAYKLILLDEGGSIMNNPDFNCSGTCHTSRSANAMNTFASKLGLIKNCGTGMGCWYTTSLRYLNGSNEVTNYDLTNNGSFGKAILADGTMMLIKINDTNCTTAYGSPPVNSPIYSSICGNIKMDLNGSQ